MTKEQLKYYIDNFDSFSTELEQKISSIPYEQLEIVDNLNMDSIQDYEKAYEIYSEFCKDIFEKYQMNLEAFTTILSLQESDREIIIGREKNTQLLKRKVIVIFTEMKRCFVKNGLNIFLMKIIQMFWMKFLKQLKLNIMNTLMVMKLMSMLI